MGKTQVALAVLATIQITAVGTQEEEVQHHADRIGGDPLEITNGRQVVTEIGVDHLSVMETHHQTGGGECALTKLCRLMPYPDRHVMLLQSSMQKQDFLRICRC